MFSDRRSRPTRLRCRAVGAGALGRIGLGSLAAVVLCVLAPAVAIGSTAYPYTLTDVGTFGGPHAELNGPAVQITRRGAVLGLADTTIPDEDYPNDGPFGSNPQIAHAFSYRDGRLTDLGALPGNNSSAVFEVNARGVGAGGSETGGLDPFTGAPAQHPVLFRDGAVSDLGTLPGGTQGFALAINDRGLVAGMSNNGIRDPFAAQLYPWPTEVRAFIWQNGVMHDLGTLGGPDASLATINARGQAAGDSYINDTVNAATGVPTIHPYLWTNGHMRDLGTLGGTVTLTAWLNQRGEVAGQSTLAGDHAAHPFLWDGHKLRDLGTFGGDFGAPWHLNDRGDVVGWAMPGGNQTIHAFLWRHGTMTDLTDPAGPDCSSGDWINNRDQVVGDACSAAILWTDGKEYDLNTLVAPTDAHLTEAPFIDDRGDITALGTLPNGNQHVFLLRPTGAPLPSTPQTPASHQPSSDRTRAVVNDGRQETVGRLFDHPLATDRIR